jgi:ribonuclease VapC
VIVDSSALLAILQQELEADRLVHALAGDPVRLILTVNWLEASMVAFGRTGEEGVRDLNLLVAKLRLDIVAVTPKQGELARRAFLRYGKGIHPARLNFGDCWAYALAQDRGEPLLFKGEDFAQTDIAAVAY